MRRPHTDLPRLYVILALTLHLAFYASPAHAQSDTGSAAALSVLVREVHVEGGFSELSAITEALIAPFKGRRSTVDELQALAQALEFVYQQAGYFLVRVTIPPQEVNDGDPFRLLVIDGYLEAVDLQGVPLRLRSHVGTLLAPLTGKQQLTMATFERTMMLARQSPGLDLKTTLVPGEGVGAAVLAAQGEWTRFSGSVGVNKHRLHEGVPWSALLQLQLNQPLGRGDGWTIRLSGPASSSSVEARSGSFGGGIRWLLGQNGMSLQLNVNASQTDSPSPHWLIPATRNSMQRASLELAKPLWLSPQGELRLSGTLEATDQTLRAPDFDVTLHQDGLRVLRFGVNARRESPQGSRQTWAVQLHQGLKALGARTAEDVQKSGIPFSRHGADPAFQKLSVNASWRLPLGSRSALTSTLRGQYALKVPLPTTELFSLSGGNALPSLALGIGANDHGWTLREEVETRFALFQGALQLSAHGYLAAGATAGEVLGMKGSAGAAGVGLRADAGRVRMSLEYSRGRADTIDDEALTVSVEVVF